jgi:hypothetical protein
MSRWTGLAATLLLPTRCDFPATDTHIATLTQSHSGVAIIALLQDVPPGKEQVQQQDIYHALNFTNLLPGAVFWLMPHPNVLECGFLDDTKSPMAYRRVYQVIRVVESWAMVNPV